VAVLGVDIGGTSIRAGLFSTPGRLEAHTQVRTRQWGWPLELAPLSAFLLEQMRLWEPVYGRIEAAGFALAAVVRADTGFVQVAENLGWASVPFGETISAALGRPVRVDTDAFCGALAEGTVGAARGVADFLYVVVGTGIGHGLVLDGRIHHGLHGSANVFGHLKVVPNGEPCYCGGSGCLCQYASGPALLHHAQQASGQADLTAEAFALARRDGADWAATVANAWLGWMAPVLANALNLLDIETVVLGGGVVQADFPNMEELQRRVQELAYPQIRPLNLRRAALGGESVLAGAAQLAFETQDRLL
jgi:glucokinase